MVAKMPFYSTLEELNEIELTLGFWQENAKVPMELVNYLILRTVC